MASELAQITKLESALVKAKTLTEIKGVMDKADAIAHAAKCWGADRRVLLEAVWVYIDGYVKIGELLGPPPGKGVGGGRGKKLSSRSDSLSKDQINKARRAAYKVSRETREAYRKWLTHHSLEDPTFKDILILSRCPEDLQDEAIAELQTGKASTLTEAIRNVKRRRIGEGEALVPKGKYRCLIVDPPWPIAKIEREEAPAQGKSLDYSTMSLDEIKAFPIPAHDECHMYLWTTQKFLPKSFEILEAWKFDYLVTMVWHKNGGFQPVNLPQFNCEFVLLGRRGGLPFVDTKNFFCCFSGKRREHSRKPTEFYDLVRRVSPGPRCDLFSTGKVEGFTQGGMQTEKFV